MKKKHNFKNIIKIIIIIFTALILFTSCEMIDNFTSKDKKNDNNTVEDKNGQEENEDDDNEEIVDDPDAKVEIGFAAPDFRVKLLNGKTAKLSKYRGKAVLINFWATWCGPCVGEMPDIQKLSETFPDDLVVLAVNCNEKKDNVDKFIKDNGYTFRIGLDENGEIQNKYPSSGIPYSIIVNPDGIITEIHLGASGDMFTIYEKDIKAALGK